MMGKSPSRIENVLGMVHSTAVVKYSVIGVKKSRVKFVRLTGTRLVTTAFSGLYLRPASETTASMAAETHQSMMKAKAKAAECKSRTSL